MFHRLLAMCIVGFWLAMTGLLVVRELYPEATGLNSVPVSHVVRLFFQHEQSSDLRILSPRREIGDLHLQARPAAKSRNREMDLRGNATLALPDGRQQRLSWEGRVEMNPRFEVERFHVDLATMEPSQRLDITVDLAARTAVFGVKMGEELVNETSVTLDEAGFSALMATAKINPAMVQQLKSAGGGMPGMALSAQTSSLVLGGERLSTYLLTLKAGDERIIEAQVSQLGQVLSAQAPLLGFKLTPQNLPR